MQKWTLLSSENVLSTKWLEINKNSYKLPNGKIVTDYFHLNRPDYVLIIATNDIGEILVEKQYRRGVDDFVYELPAGWIEHNEQVENAALRELKEETGNTGEPQLLGELYPQPGFSSMKAYVVHIRISTKEPALGNMAPDENITYEFMNKAMLRASIAKGAIKDMGFLAAIRLYESDFNVY